MLTAVEAVHCASMTQVQQPPGITRSALSMTIASGYVPGEMRSVSPGLAASMALWNGVPGPGFTTMVLARPGAAAMSVTRLTPRATVRIHMANLLCWLRSVWGRDELTPAMPARLDAIVHPGAPRPPGPHPARPGLAGTSLRPRRCGPATRPPYRRAGGRRCESSAPGRR